jgi:hypothetical protein
VGSNPIIHPNITERFNMDAGTKTVVRRTSTALAAIAALVLALFVWGSTHNPANASMSFNSGGVSLTVSVTCSNQTTTVTKLSSNGGNPGYAARVQGKGGTWYQGPEKSSGTASESLQAGSVPAKNHGVRVFWASGAQNYTFC